MQHDGDALDRPRWKTQPRRRSWPRRRPDDRRGRERRAAGRPTTSRTRRAARSRTIVRANIFTPFNFLLGTLLVVILAVGEYRDALFGIVLVANALIGIVQEVRSKRALDRLAVLNAPQADGRARRQRRSRSPTNELVLDDVIVLALGDQISVDGDVLDAIRPRDRRVAAHRRGRPGRQGPR